jgi:hypothetical protein
MTFESATTSPHGAWKLAAIVEGAYAHFVAGNLDSPYARGLAHDVPALLDATGEFAGLVPPALR